MIYAVLASALFLSIAALRWAMRGNWRLSILAALASLLFICALPVEMFSGYDLRTFTAVLPVGVCSWAVIELLFRWRIGYALPPDESSREVAQFTLRTFVIGITALAIVFGLMSLAKTLNGPRDVTGRFVQHDSIDKGVENVVMWFHPRKGVSANPVATNLADREPKTVVATFTEQAITHGIIRLSPGDTLVLKNAMDVAINVYVWPKGYPRPSFIPVIEPAGEFRYSPTRSYSNPTRLICVSKKHYAWLFVTDHPVAVSDADGRWSLPAVVPGEYRVRIWHQKTGNIEQTETRNARLLSIRKSPQDRILKIGSATRSIGDCFLETLDGIPLKSSSPEPVVAQPTP